MTITAAQVRAIHVALAKRGIEDAEYRRVLASRFGVETCKSLTRAQATDLLATLWRPLPPRAKRPVRGSSAGKRRRARPAAAPNAANVVDLPSPEQLALIDELAGRLGWGTDALRSWSRKSFGWHRPRTMADARLAIEGLKAMSKRAGRWAE